MLASSGLPILPDCRASSIAFFTAFLPQFIDPALPVGFQIVVMSLASLLIAAVFDSGWAIAAGLGRAWFRLLNFCCAAGEL